MVTETHIANVKAFFETKAPAPGEEDLEEKDVQAGPVGYIPDICHDNKVIWS